MFFAGSEDEFAEENDNTILQVEDMPTNASPPLKQTSKMRVWRPHEWKQNRAKNPEIQVKLTGTKNIIFIRLRGYVNLAITTVGTDVLLIFLMRRLVIFKEYWAR